MCIINTMMMKTKNVIMEIQYAVKLHSVVSYDYLIFVGVFFGKFYKIL